MFFFSKEWAMKQNRTRNSILYGLLLLSLCTAFLYFASAFVSENFGRVTISQILFHLGASGTHGGDPSQYLSALKWLALFVATAGGIILFVRRAARASARSAVRPRIFSVCTAVLILFSSFSMVMAEKNLEIVGYAVQKESEWFEENYARLDTENFRNVGQRNLIVIFLESMERGYADATTYGEDLIPELIALRDEGCWFSGHRKTPGAWFTIDGLSAQLLGVPLAHLGLDFYSMDERFHALLKNSPSIFDLLKNDGYVTAAFSGASEKFTQKGSFFRAHGIDAVYAREHWEGAEGLSEEQAGHHFGLRDEFLWARFREYLDSVSRTGDRFAVLFETLDTHSPNGFATGEDVRFGDARDAMRASSRMAAEFLRWAAQQPWYQDTTIVIVGDHPWQDAPNDFTEKFTSQSRDREIFNVILNTHRGVKGEGIVLSGWSSMDMAPTILHAMGVEFRSRLQSGAESRARMGLGTSLFSGEPNLLSRYGLEVHNEELSKPSEFYDSLF